MQLTPGDREMLDGARGPAMRMAMRILTRMGEVQDAREMLTITQAHIDSTIFIADAGLEYAERLASFGAKVAVPTTLNVSGLDENRWREWAVPSEWASKAFRQMQAYQSMGAVPTWTCAPYQTEHAPRFGQQIAWGESNAIVFANSVIGARTERYPDLLDICAAITGRVPAVGLHLDENRGGDLLVELRGVARMLQEDDSFYPVFGHLLGKLAGNRIPVIEGIEARPSDDQLKALGAGAASSGSVALFHIVRVTPEAPTRAAAFLNREPCETHTITMADLRRARDELTSGGREKIDMVVLGSPHFSLAEFRALAELVRGRRCHPDVRFLLTTSRAVEAIARHAGVMDAVEAFGAKLTVDTCILATPMLPDEIQRLMTNSAKFAYYTPGLLGRSMAFGSLADCVESAVAGRVIRDDSLWK